MQIPDIENQDHSITASYRKDWWNPHTISIKIVFCHWRKSVTSQIKVRHSTSVQTHSVNSCQIKRWMQTVNSLSNTPYYTSYHLKCWPFIRTVRPASLHQFCQLLWAFTVSHHRTKWWGLPGSHMDNDLCTISPKNKITLWKHIFGKLCATLKLISFIPLLVTVKVKNVC